MQNNTKQNKKINEDEIFFCEEETKHKKFIAFDLDTNRLKMFMERYQTA